MRVSPLPKSLEKKIAILYFLIITISDMMFREIISRDFLMKKKKKKKAYHNCLAIISRKLNNIINVFRFLFVYNNTFECLYL